MVGREEEVVEEEGEGAAEAEAETEAGRERAAAVKEVDARGDPVEAGVEGAREGCFLGGKARILGDREAGVEALEVEATADAAEVEAFG